MTGGWRKRKGDHRNLLTQCMFLPVEQVDETVGEESEPDTDVRDADMESDTAEDDMGGSVDRVLPGPSNIKDEHTSTEDEDMVVRVMSEGEANETDSGDNFPQGPSCPRRNPQRNRRPPRKLSCESQVMETESDQKKIERGRQLWLKTKRAAGPKWSSRRST